MKIWVLFRSGADSDHPEYHECLRLREEADKAGAALDIMDVDNFDLVVDSTDEWRAVYNGLPVETPALIIPRTGAETSYTGFAVIRFYESLNVPIVNGSAAIEASADKLQTLQTLAASGFPIPRTILGKFPPDIGLIENRLGFPLVIKTLRGTRGGGVFLSETKEQFRDLTDLIAESNSNVHFLFQNYIRKSHGCDLRVLVGGGRVIACMKRQSTDGNFKSNISRGGHGAPYPVTPEIERLALGAARTLGLDVAGIDLLIDGDTFEICEANSAPGFKGLEEFCKVNAAAEILKTGMEKTKIRRTFWPRVFRRKTP